MDRNTELSLIEKFIAEHGVKKWEFVSPEEDALQGSWLERQHQRRLRRDPRRPMKKRGRPPKKPV